MNITDALVSYLAVKYDGEDIGIDVRYESDDRIFIAEAAEIGCWASGATEDEAVRALFEVIRDHEQVELREVVAALATDHDDLVNALVAFLLRGSAT